MRHDKKDIRNANSHHIAVNPLMTAFENSFPLFHSAACCAAVDGGGKNGQQKVIRKRATISTSYPQ